MCYAYLLLFFCFYIAILHSNICYSLFKYFFVSVLQFFVPIRIQIIVTVYSNIFFVSVLQFFVSVRIQIFVTVYSNIFLFLYYSFSFMFVTNICYSFF